MAVVSTDNTLTVDANVIGYYFQFLWKNSLPAGLGSRRIGDFCTCIVEKYPIAFNEFIETEYRALVGYEQIKIWLTKRLQKDLAIKVERLSLENSIKSRLRNDYGFDCNSMDAKYIETCNNTIFKHFVTENTAHFIRPHRTGKRQPMHDFLRYRLGIQISKIDDCCNLLLTP